MTYRIFNRKFRKYITFTICLILMVIFLSPIFWLIISSIRPEKELLSVPPKWLPEKLIISNYEDVFSFQGYRFYNAMINSIIVSFSTMVICLILGSLAAYALARFQFQQKTRIMESLLFVQMLPSVIMIIPLFIIMKKIGLFDTVFSLIIVDSAFILPVIIWFLVSFFKSVPQAVEDASFVDGCTRLESLRHIILPLVSPGLAATAVMAFITTWKEFFFALILGPNKATVLPAALGLYIGTYDVKYNLIMTAGVLSILPVILLAIIFERYLLRGLTMGAVKE